MDTEKKNSSDQVGQAEHGHDHVHGPGCAHHHAQAPYVRLEKKIGRNDPCSCGSDLKYKKCCGRPQ